LPSARRGVATPLPRPLSGEWRRVGRGQPANQEPETQTAHRRQPDLAHSQGFVDAWAPIFFAMIVALAMDYTVFPLATVKEHLERG
jgi:hypothetical protein